MRSWVEQTLQFVSDGSSQMMEWISPARPDLWITTHHGKKLFWDDTLSPMEWMMQNFDTNGDGHISPSELVNLTEILKHLPHLQQESWTLWFRREWPLMDWKVGVFLWRSFGGVLFLLTILTIVPGRLHGLSAKILRWPLLGLVYFLILVELMYVPVTIFL